MAQNEWTFELGGSWIDMMRKEYDDKHDADDLKIKVVDENPV